MKNAENKTSIVVSDINKQEQNDNARPALAEDKDISEYDVIFLGFPKMVGRNADAGIYISGGT